MIIEILYTSPKCPKIGSEAIKLYLGTTYSHVAIRWYSDSLERYMVYHAARGSVHFINNDLFLEKNKVIHVNKLDICQERYLKLVRRCVDLAGFPYGYSELINILYGDLYYRLNGVWPTTGDSKGYICSELLADLLSELTKTINKPEHLINPRDIYEALNG